MIPTTSETLDALIAICEQAQLAIREIGQIVG